jgi:AraC-like DNA-binding protein
VDVNSSDAGFPREVFSPDGVASMRSFEISSSETRPLIHVSAIDLMSGDTESAISLQRLRSAVVEVLTALNKALHDEGRKPAECLLRAQAILEAVEQPAATALAAAPHGLAPWQIRGVLTYVDSNLDAPIRNRDLAAVARLSEFHFNAAFRNSVGHSPHDYVMRRRMERAQGLMLSTDKPLSEIAVECGLADQPHLTRLFRRFVGESPAAWRRVRANAPSGIVADPALAVTR